ncbi:ABC-F family ATP-binding cassette domain-containing protein [Kitasatospora sp. CM 4170]|uniref:ABC-F family ATP-binding cassette domain-containing protein n=1 Tax=Kitasatospora aburaviensis TaxID=67265 RepID=A0ABW1EUP0_9ACTN|nr:ABC-F family ATP-binding cassette domain-containing protein [Kitasatospora sp. CM 4170]WNM43651.1 ABC-F family ATP-binding cassette domain-containing protein [Kitasatospora sp. CM 4170]
MLRSQLSVQNVTRRYDDRTVLDAVSFTVKPGEKAGIIGDNGAGKSTLLRLVAGADRPDHGEVTAIAPGGVGYLAQALALPPHATVQSAIDLALADLRDLEARMRRAEAALGGLAPEELAAALDAYAELVARYESRAGYEADARVDVALHGLGLPGLDRTRALGTLSGGERSRLALAATLASQPELLLLDEPTNDLDDQALVWLEEHLRAHRGTVLAVTHDRVFLERVTTAILEVAEGKVTRHGDGYAGYLAAKAAEHRYRVRAYEDWRAELARNSRLAATNVARLDRIPRKLPLSVFGHGGFRSRGRGHGAMSRVRNAKERVERLTSSPVAPPPEPLVFTPDLGGTVAVDAARPARAAQAGQPGQAVRPVQAGHAVQAVQPAAELTGIRVADRLHLPSLRIAAGERLLVTGPNGAGKTTLMRLLAGELQPDEGTVRTRGRVGHLRQDTTAWAPDLTVLQAFAHGRTGAPDDHADALLALGLFNPSDLRLTVGALSYGQQRRIELARLVSGPVDLLLLDEPTNHLSPALVEHLQAALTDYPGAVVIVTHDRRLRADFTGSQLELEAGHSTWQSSTRLASAG